MIKRIGLILGPVLFIVILMSANSSLEQSSWNVLAIAAWMVTWWITEAIPIYATALIPLVMFPYLGVFDVSRAASSYANSIIFLFMGGFIIALGLEKHNLHRRIALNLIRITGTGANGIILGFMLATFFLSMWISNTATAVMMLPIATSVVSIIKEQVGDGNTKGFKLFALALFLGIAYSANIGGTSTIIGTPPNVVLMGYFKEFYDYEVAFSDWILIGLPTAILLMLLTFILLTRVMYRNKLGEISGASGVLRQHLKDMGPFGQNEKLVTLIFGLTALAWIFKNPVNNLIGFTLLNDTVTAMSGGVLMFITPIHWKSGENLLDWDDMIKLPWGILILFGGGICLANGMAETGLIQLIGETISNYPGIEGWVLILVLTTLVLFMTELMSNVALITIFIPVVFGIAQGLGMDPLLLSIPVTFAASCAFMMPISTPPNAIVFASGHIRIKDMVRAGFILNIISIIILVLFSQGLFRWVFGGDIG